MKHGDDDDYNGSHHFFLPFGGSGHGQQVEDTTIKTTTFPSTANISSTSFQISDSDVVDNKQYQQQKPRKKRSCSRMMRMDNKSLGVVAEKAADTSEPDITRQCTECGKKFWSWKALFGHMRCHPERQWRGINPPPNFKRPFSLHPPTTTPPHQMGYEEDEAMEWTSIPAEGLASAALSPPGCYSSQQMMGEMRRREEELQDDYEVAACLLLLANAGGTGIPHPNPNTSVGERQQQLQALGLEAKEDNDIVPAPPACSKLDDDETACAAAVSGGNINDNIHVGEAVIVVEGAATSVNLTTTTTLNSESKCCSISRPSFECSSCKKVFGSHQALGGHRASHKNVKGCFAINSRGPPMTRITNNAVHKEEDDHHYESCSGTGRSLMGIGGVGRRDDNHHHKLLVNDCNELGESSEGVGGGEDSSGFNNDNNDNKALMEEGHRCSICLRIFSSGQALGGHKRCHWDKFGHDIQHHPPPPSSLVIVSHGVAHHHHHDPNKGGDDSGYLDLNFPAPPTVDHNYHHSSLLLHNSSSYGQANLDLRLGL